MRSLKFQIAQCMDIGISFDISFIFERQKYSFISNYEFPIMFILPSEVHMTKQQLISLCLSHPQSYEDYPFDNTTPVIRHAANKKMFALIGEHEGSLSINLKCDPFEADFLRQTFRDILPGYHMNKQHWNTVIVGGDVPIDELKRLIEKSYDLIKPKLRKRKV